ncbi:MAG TPA: sigma-70 family RNA polymerase sigma factor [Labilithrix sp.]|nr:sigma-70 family RNA polymerase sigma factor [Labilithrix sp.]
MSDFDAERLALAHEDARVAWQGIDVPFEVFADWVRTRAARSAEERQDADVHDEPGHLPAGGELHFNDLYLACACAHDVPGAVQRLLVTHQEAIDSVARRIGLSSDARDDLVQILGERMFVTADDGTRRIARYSGTGPLRGWIKAVATRIALDLVRRAPRDKPSDEEPDDYLLARFADSPDVRFEKESDRTHVRTAIRAAFQSLTSQERNLLRYALLDGLGIDELARIYQVHRATAARRLVAARDRLATGVRQWLRVNLQLDERACASLLREGLSQVDLTLRTKVSGVEP